MRFQQVRPLPWPQLLVNEFLFVGSAMKKMESFVSGEPAKGKILRAFVDSLSHILRYYSFVVVVVVDSKADQARLI